MITSRYLLASLFAVSSFAALGQDGAPATAASTPPPAAASAPMPAAASSTAATAPMSASSTSMPAPASSVAEAPPAPAQRMPNTKKTDETYAKCVEEKTAATDELCTINAKACAVDKKDISTECHGEVDGFKKKGAVE